MPYVADLEYWAHGVGISSVGGLGVVGNVLILAVLSRRAAKRTSINLLLSALAVADATVIATGVVTYSLPALVRVGPDQNILNYVIPYVYPVGMVVQTTSVYITLVISLERYLVVCHPLDSRSLCTYGRTKKWVAAVVAASLAYNAPRFFEFQYEANELVVGADNRTATVVRVVPTALREDDRYIAVYVNWTYTCFMYAVPFCLLFAANAKILWEIRRARRTRSLMLTSAQRSEQSLAIVLIVVVGAFICCNSPAMVANVIEAFGMPRTRRLEIISDLLVIINSSVNIFIYCLLGENFRKLFRAMLCGERPGGSGEAAISQLQHSTTPSLAAASRARNAAGLASEAKRSRSVTPRINSDLTAGSMSPWKGPSPAGSMEFLPQHQHRRLQQLQQQEHPQPQRDQQQKQQQQQQQQQQFPRRTVSWRGSKAEPAVIIEVNVVCQRTTRV